MAYHHHHRHRETTATACCTTCTCQTPLHHPYTPPLFSSPPPSLQPPTDPFLIATIVSQLLQTNQTPQNHFHKPTNTNQSHHQIQTSPLISSLIERIDSLETSLHHLVLSSSKSTSCFTLKNAAARVIQTHFRAFLVRRSSTLRHLKHLACIKSNVTSLKSSFSSHGFVDYDSVSRKAMDLLFVLDTIQGEDQMIRESKKSITREIVQFLELVDGFCVQRHQVLTRNLRNMRLVKIESARTGHVSKRHVEGSKHGNVDREEKKLIASLRDRVERIGRMSRALDAEEVGEDVIGKFEHGFLKDGDSIDQITSSYGARNGGVNVNRNGVRSIGKKQVCFLEDGNIIKVYNADGDKIFTSRDVDEIEGTLKGRHDEVEAQSDSEQSSESSEGMRNQRSYKVPGDDDHKVTFFAPESVADYQRGLYPV